MPALRREFTLLWLQVGNGQHALHIMGDHNPAAPFLAGVRSKPSAWSKPCEKRKYTDPKYAVTAGVLLKYDARKCWQQEMTQLAMSC